MADIAQAIGVSVATVSRRIARAERAPRSQAPEREGRGA
jgi:DNA-binding LacI/PurR family transcriptional regulator